MRDSYLSYAIKLIREKKFKILFKQVHKFFAIPASYMLKKTFCGPVHGIFVVTYDCNQRCKMCDLYKRPFEFNRKKMKPLTTEEMFAIIDDFAEIGTSGIGFTGGEPILRTDIRELIKYAKEQGLFTHMSSNGMNIDLDCAKSLIEAGLDAVSFSLDGSNKDTHDSIRGVKGSFEKVINSIRNCRAVKNELGSNFVIISVCVINNKNFDEVVDLVEVAQDAGVDKVSFSPVHDVGLMRNKERVLSDLFISKENLQKVDQVIDTLIKIKKTRKVIDNSEDYLRLFKRAFRNEKLPFYCYAGYVSLGVDYYGNMFPCFGWMEMGRFTENIRNISLKDFWGSKKMKEMRKEIKGCQNCYWNNQAELNLTFLANSLSRI